jgi:hypothetical protein
MPISMPRLSRPRQLRRLGYEIERRRFVANLSRGELAESRHDLSPRGECEDFPDAMNVVERERHVVSSKRGRMAGKSMRETPPTAASRRCGRRRSAP